MAPRGSDVLIVLTNRQESGRFTGKAELRLALRSLTVQGKRYDASSTDVVEASSSRTARSGKAIGGLAAAGAVIGADRRRRKGGRDWSRFRRHTGDARRGVHIRSASPRAFGDAAHVPIAAAVAGELSESDACCRIRRATVLSILAIQTDKSFGCGIRPA